MQEWRGRTKQKQSLSRKRFELRGKRRNRAKLGTEENREMSEEQEMEAGCQKQKRLYREKTLAESVSVGT